MSQSEQIHFRYAPDRTDPIEVWARSNKSKSSMGQTELLNRKFIQTMRSIAQDPPVRDPGPYGSYLSWVEDFILGYVPALKLISTKKDNIGKI